MPNCRLDAWTLAFKKHYVGRYDTAECRADLVLTAMFVKTDTSQIEAKHAAVRRGLKKAQTQAHGQKVTRANSDFVVREFQNQPPASLPRCVSAAEPTPDGAQDGATSSLRRGGAAEEELFVHSYTVVVAAVEGSMLRGWRQSMQLCQLRRWRLTSS